jgi:putative endonuclease
MGDKKNTKTTGDLGERVAVEYLKRFGFVIVETNYWKKWGEIDIVARKENKMHFVEVKTVSHETKKELEYAVSRGIWRPEEQVHAFKLKQIHKAVQTWITENKYAGEFQIDVLALRIVPRETFASVNYIENVIAEGNKDA